MGCPHIQQMASSGCLVRCRRWRATLFFQVRECECGVFLLMVSGGCGCRARCRWCVCGGLRRILWRGGLGMG
mgnify:CR=1 FL=1